MAEPVRGRATRPAAEPSSGVHPAHELDHASLRGANLTDADLTNASARFADFTDAILDRTILRGTDLTGARITADQLRSAITDEQPILGRRPCWIRHSRSEPMGVIDLSKCPVKTGSIYPEPYASQMAGRSSLRLGDAAGLTQFGANLVTLEPGARSSLRHWHRAEDEFVMVTEGELVLIQDEGEYLLRPGDCAAWKAGDPQRPLLRQPHRPPGPLPRRRHQGGARGRHLLRRRPRAGAQGRRGQLHLPRRHPLERPAMSFREYLTNRCIRIPCRFQHAFQPLQPPVPHRKSRDLTATSET